VIDWGFNLQPQVAHWKPCEGVDLFACEQCSGASTVGYGGIGDIDLAKKPTIKLATHLGVGRKVKKTPKTMIYDILTLLVLELVCKLLDQWEAKDSPETFFLAIVGFLGGYKSHETVKRFFHLWEGIGMGRHCCG
jgi:hypothetical protein